MRFAFALLPLLLFLTVPPSARALTFNLEAGVEDCFYEDVPAGSDVSGSFQARSQLRQSFCQRIPLTDSSPQVSLGGFLDIDVKVHYIIPLPQLPSFSSTNL